MRGLNHCCCRVDSLLSVLLYYLLFFLKAQTTRMPSAPRRLTGRLPLQTTNFDEPTLDRLHAQTVPKGNY